jgi:hypothetical protein
MNILNKQSKSILNKAEQIGGNSNQTGEIAALRAIIHSYTCDPAKWVSNFHKLPWKRLMRITLTFET